MDFQEWYNKHHVSFYDPASSGVAEMTLVPGDDVHPDEYYFFNRLITKQRGKGGGSRLLQKVKEIADKHNIPIINPVNAYGDHTQEETIQWFIDRGFVKLDNKFDPGVVIYYPRSNTNLSSSG